MSSRLFVPPLAVDGGARRVEEDDTYDESKVDDKAERKIRGNMASEFQFDGNQRSDW